MRDPGADWEKSYPDRGPGPVSSEQQEAEANRATALRCLTQTPGEVFDSSSSFPPSPLQPFTFLFFLTSSRYESKYCHRIWRLLQRAAIAR